MQAGYFSTTWSDIKNSPNWFGKMCLLALVGLIPIFGQIVIAGYAYGWARDIAWGIHAPMPSKIFGNEDGKLYSRGFFALVISFVFSLLALVVYMVYLGVAYSGVGMGLLLLQLLQLAATIAGGVFALVGTMRMSIYGRLSPGFQINQIWKMIQKDTNGMARIVGMVALVSIVMSLVIGLVFGFMFLVVFLVGGTSVAPQLPGADIEDLLSNPAFWSALAPSLGLFVLFLLVLGFFSMVTGVFMQILSARAGGYWTRQFEVSAWGGQDDPLPFEVRANTAQTPYTAGQGGQVQGGYGNYAPSQQAQQMPYTQQPGAHAAGGAQAAGGVQTTGGAQAAGAAAPGAYAAGAQSAYPTSSQVPDWVVQANASAPIPQADPYAGTYAGQPGSDVGTAGYSAVPQVNTETPYGNDVSSPYGAQPYQAPSAAVQPGAQVEPQAFQPMSGQPMQEQPFSNQPDMQYPFSTDQTAAPASAMPAVETVIEHVERPSRDMHHKMQAKPAPRWEKIDLDALDGSANDSRHA